MPPAKNEAERWYKQAQHDLRAARWNRDGAFFDTACFLSQQAAEKALKALLYYHGARRTVLLTHSVVEMVSELERDAPEVAALGDEARSLDLHYIPARYPNGLPAGYPHQFYARPQAEAAIAAAEHILQTVGAELRNLGAEDWTV